MGAITDAQLTDEQLAARAKAVGHPARVRILRLLAARTSCMSRELAPELGLAASTTSEHLRILREAGLIQTQTPDGRLCYCLNVEGLQALNTGVRDLIPGTSGIGRQPG